MFFILGTVVFLASNTALFFPRSLSCSPPPTRRQFFGTPPPEAGDFFLAKCRPKKGSYTSFERLISSLFTFQARLVPLPFPPVPAVGLLPHVFLPAFWRSYGGSPTSTHLTPRLSLFPAIETLFLSPIFFPEGLSLL